MELLLNLVWLATVVALFALLWRQSRLCLQQRDTVLRSVATGVLSMLLLPVISMTDDLHAMTMMTEGERTKARMATSQDDSQHAVTLVFTQSVTGNIQPWTSLVCLGIVDTTDSGHFAQLQYFPSHSGRAPPNNGRP